MARLLGVPREPTAPPRLLFGAVIIAGHAAAIYVLTLRVDWDRDIGPSLLAVMPISISLTPILGLPRDEARLEIPREVNPRIAARELEPPEFEAQAASPGRETDTGKRADILTSFGRSGRHWADVDSKPLEFGRLQEDDPSTPTNRNFFEGTSPRRAGFIEMLESGVERRWISSRCYREFGKSRTAPLGAASDLNPITCLVGPGGSPRSDLFDHLKPEYFSNE